MRQAPSLRATLLRWLIVPTVVALPLNAVFTYHWSAGIANDAYDRSLLLSARTIAEGLGVSDGRLVVDLPYAAIDMTEWGLGARVLYRVSGPDGHMLGGYEDFPPMPADTPLSAAYPALVRFYDAHYHGVPVRAAALLQPVSEETLQGMALVQVAETLEAREQLIQRALTQTVVKQVLLLAMAVGMIVVAVRRGLVSLEALRRHVEARSVRDLQPFDTRLAPAETLGLLAALNRYVGRLAELVDLRKRFIENAAHQLRTPITVLKTQLALAQRERDPQALRAIVHDMGLTADTAARLARQLLSLTRAEHGVAGPREAVDLAAVARSVCLDAAPRALAQGTDLGLEAPGTAVFVDGDEVLLQEAIANLVDNALNHGGAGGRVTVRVDADVDGCTLQVDDAGPGVPEGERRRVLQRFYRAAGQQLPGSGLGLSIVAETVAQHGGRIELGESPESGLRVSIRLPVRTAAVTTCHYEIS